MAKVNLHRRSDLHLARKLFHICTGLLILYPFWMLGQPTEFMAALLGVMLSFVMSIEYSRRNFAAFNIGVVKVLGPIMRQSEVKQVSGVPFYVGSCLVAVLIFPKDIAILSILHLIFGDPFSSFFGVLFGKDKLFPNKSLQGTLGGFAVCMTVTWLYLAMNNIGEGRQILLAMIGGVSGAIAELLPLNVDDNFTIPLISGAIMFLAFWSAGVWPGI